MTSLKVAETLKELRHHRGFTQKQLSEQLHISRQAYSNYENGTRLPDLETACVIADYFQISLDQLGSCRTPSRKTGRSICFTSKRYARFFIRLPLPAR